MSHHLRKFKFSALLLILPAIASGVLPGSGITQLSYAPAVAEFGTFLLEDQAPCMGDFDFNDLVVSYHVAVGKDLISNEMQFMAWTYRLRASGARHDNGFAVALPYTNQQISSVTGPSVSWDSSNPNAMAVVRFFSNAHNELNQAGIVNTEEVAGVANELIPVEGMVSIIFNAGVSETGTPPYDLFSFRSDDTSHEVHLAGGTPTSGAQNFDGQCDISTGYQTATGLPFALKLNEALAYPQEGLRLDAAYPLIINWAGSNGSEDTDWPDSPDNTQLYSAQLGSVATLTSSSARYTLASGKNTATLVSEFSQHPLGVPTLLDWEEIKSMTAAELSHLVISTPYSAHVTRSGDIDSSPNRFYYIGRIAGETNSGALVHEAVWIDTDDPNQTQTGTLSFPDTGKRGVWLGSWYGERPAWVAWR